MVYASGPKGLCKGCRVFSSKSIAETIVHKTSQPNSFFDFFDPDRLSREHGRRINFLRRRQIRQQLATWMVRS